MSLTPDGKGHLELVEVRHLHIHNDHGISLVPQQPDGLFTGIDRIIGSFLDAGCGTGFCFQMIEDAIGPAGKLIGIEPSPGSRIPLGHGMPGSVEVDVDRATPAHLVLRAVGRVLGKPVQSQATTE